MSISGTGIDNARWVHPFGTAQSDGFEVAIVPEAHAEDNPRLGGPAHTSVRVITLDGGEQRTHLTGSEEIVIVPLSGGLTVDIAGSERITLAGRPDVWSGPSDTAYVPRGSEITLQATSLAKVALCGAVTGGEDRVRTPQRIAADAAAGELRGAGIASREVRAFGLPPTLDAESILVCEVITPAGNWSSWPPHKHDEDRPGEESVLEEIYYFEARAADAAAPTTDPVGYQRVYGTPERPIDVLAEVRSGDVVLVPHGWHGPAMAAPDADLYYLNVMAGPGDERAWLICDDPRHAAVRDAWADQQIDPRLPFGDSGGGAR